MGVGTRSQRKMILRYMQKGHEISGRKASQMFDCDRLSARIWELRREGYVILDRWEKTMFGKKYKVYFMKVAIA